MNRIAVKGERGRNVGNSLQTKTHPDYVQMVIDFCMEHNIPEASETTGMRSFIQEITFLGKRCVPEGGNAAAINVEDVRIKFQHNTSGGKRLEKLMI